MSPSTYDVLDVEDLLVLFEVSIFNVIITISVAVIGIVRVIVVVFRRIRRRANAACMVVAMIV
jgi:hypothetical protein